MKLTPYETGERRPHEHFPDDGTERALEIEQARREARRERWRRQQLVIQARPQFTTLKAMAELLGTHSGCISKWTDGRQAVPDKYVDTLERLVRGEPCD